MTQTLLLSKKQQKCGLMQRTNQRLETSHGIGWHGWFLLGKTCFNQVKKFLGREKLCTVYMLAQVWMHEGRKGYPRKGWRKA